MPAPLIPGAIPPLVRRHAEDAAFYWNRHDASADSPRLGLAALGSFSQLLAAHLEGLAVAGAHAWPHCHAALERWKKPAEAFVCAYVAFAMAEPAYSEALLKQLRAHPDQLLRGVVSALAWLPAADAGRVIAQWTGTDSDSVMQVAALRAIALIGGEAALVMARPLSAFLADPDPHVRAAACRAAAALPGASGQWDGVHALLDDPVAAVRAEAAIAIGSLAGHARPSAARPFLPILWHCVATQAELAAGASGWYRMQAQRRLERWVQQLALLQPPGAACAAALAALPARVCLCFVAWHGDPCHLPLVIEHMDMPGLERYAGWVWQTMTGVDLVASGLGGSEPKRDQPTPRVSGAGTDADFGLALPDVAAVRRHPSGGLSHGLRYLAGAVLTPARARELLRDAPQALRSIAAASLQQSHPGLRVHVRASALVQQACIARIDAMLAGAAVR